MGRGIVGHPWYSIVLWTAVLAICIVPATNLGSAISGTFGNPLPSSDQSVQAQNAFATQFPHSASSPSSAIVLLEGPNIIGPAGKNATLAVTQALARDPRLKDVSSVVSLYSAYSAYLTGQVDLGWSFLGPALSETPSLPETVNSTASALWSPAATYLQNWENTVANLTPGAPASQADWPAFNQTRAEYLAGSTASQVLAAFYEGGNASVVGFNASVFNGCLGTQNATSCANAAMRNALPPVLPTLFPASGNRTAAELVLSDLNLGNWSLPGPRQAVGATLLGVQVGISPAWLLTLWHAFPFGTPPSPTAVATWVDDQVQQTPIDRLPLPIPPQIYSSFVNSAGTATLVVISFSVADTYTENGSTVTYADVSEIRTVVSQALDSSLEYSEVTPYETGAAPLDSATTYLATSALSLLLVLTIVVLLVIMLLYFRAPAAPALSFGMIGIAMVVTLAGVFVLGEFVTKFNSEIESIVLVFLMSIGTDYSVFLLARYREELVRGASSTEAVETTVRWAGQSITTSGVAVMVVAVALSLSGISFLGQLGDALLLTVVAALLVNLTVLPSILVLVGPRIFWPNSGARFQRYAERRRQNIASNRDYIARAGRTATRRPLAVIAVVMLISVPVVIVALEVPVSYDITNLGLPSSNSAQVGFQHLTGAFGASYFSPSDVLVTFSAPLISSSGINTQEFRDASGLATIIDTTPGVASVSTLVGVGGVPLDAWLNFSTLPPAQQVVMNETLSSYLGVDGRTVLFNVQTNESGYSAPAISVVNDLHQRIQAFEAGHPEVQQAYYGGAAQTTEDIQSMVNRATEEMLIGATIGLFLIMLLILGSAFVPILALGAIGLSILWSWAATYFVVGIVENEALIFLLPLILLILVLGLGMDYNVLLLTRVKEERARRGNPIEAIQQAVTHAGGVITAAAVILGGAFLLLGLTSPLGMLAGVGLGIGIAVLLQAFVVQTYLTPAVLAVGKDRIWQGWRRSRPGSDPGPTGPDPVPSRQT
ncbi:MAG: MMPL family transporter [Thermoplasmata archaeon]